MKLVAGWVVSAGLVLAATTASAQVLAPVGAGPSPYRPVSDFEGPYGSMPPAPPPYQPAPYAPPAPYASPAPYPYAYEPALMPPHEVYAVLREHGFQPLGIPRRLGQVYEISAIDPAGDDGRLVIDGRTGRIIRFMPAYWGDRSEYAPRSPYGAHAAMPRPGVRDAPRPPATVPHVASRTAPLPARKPALASARSAEPVRSAPQRPAEQGPVQVQASLAASQPVTSSEVRPQPQIGPTQAMPPVQGLE
jgi:hypothetical protein